MLNIEIKARCADPAFIRGILRAHKADFKGTDRQTDTYFKIKKGRLKLRQGNIENSLIFYLRENKKGPKDSRIHLFKTARNPMLKALLEAALGTLVEVKKTREIYFIGNVKFHLDKVAGLGSFVEIEAIDETGRIGRAKMLAQCEHYLALFRISEKDLLKNSYSDMLLKNRHA